MYLEFYITRNPNHSEQTTIHYNSWSLNSTPWSSTLLTIYPPPYKSSESWTKSLQLIGFSTFRSSRITRRWRARIRRSLCWRTCTRTRSTTSGLQPSQGWILLFPIWSWTQIQWHYYYHLSVENFWFYRQKGLDKIQMLFKWSPFLNLHQLFNNITNK